MKHGFMAIVIIAVLAFSGCDNYFHDLLRRGGGGGGGGGGYQPNIWRVAIDLEVMTNTNSNWHQLLRDIQAEGKIVDLLDLSECIIQGGNSTVFNPDRNAEYRKDLIKSIILPDVATSITAGVYDSYTDERYFPSFEYFTALKSFKGGRDLTSIGDQAFARISSLTEIILPDGFTSFGGRYVFYGCTGLTKVTLPDGLTDIGSWTFAECTNLTTINVPDGVTSIGDGTFSSCTSLKTITLHDGLKSITAQAFAGSGLTKITLPAGVVSIGDRAFISCVNLTEVEFTLPASLESIGNLAFNLGGNPGPGLTTVTLPEGLKTIGGSAFTWQSNLTTVTLPATLESIGEGAFSTNANLKTVICKAGTPPLLYCQDWSATYLRTFANTHADLKIYVPDGSVAAYKAAQYWTTYYQSQIYSIDVMP